MVKETKKEDKKYYVCEACDMAYEDKDIAKKCEDWCNENHSCNLEIIKHAVKL